MYLAALTWDELAELSRERVVLLPWAGFEQHGRHLPLDTDAQILNALCARLEEQIPDRILIAPLLSLSDSRRHQHYPGTLSLDPELAVGVAVRVLCDLTGLGFQQVLLLNGQWGNEALVELVLRELRQRQPGVSAVGISYWDLLSLEPDRRGHAGELETSLLLHLAPERVRREHLVREDLRPASPFAEHTLQYLRTEQHSRTGSLGDSTCADATQGAKWLQEMVNNLIALVGDFINGRLTV